MTTSENFTTVIMKNASLDWEETGKARECLLNYMARRGNLKPISEWVEPEGTTVWTMVADNVTNQFSGFTYNDGPILVLLVFIFLQ